MTVFLINLSLLSFSDDNAARFIRCDVYILSDFSG